MKRCMFCGAQIPDDALFCNVCGKKQVKQYTQTFVRKNMTQEIFIEKINEWFWKYPQVTNVKIKMDTDTGLGLMVSHQRLDAVTISYACCPQGNPWQYALTQVQDFNLVKKSCKEVLKGWMAENPGTEILETSGTIHQRGHAGSMLFNGFGAANLTQIYIFFRFPRTSVPGSETGR